MTTPMSTYEIARFAQYADLLTEVTILRADARLLAKYVSDLQGAAGRRHRYLDRTAGVREYT